ncbi:TPA: translesion error-prone DNA polymerase V autoproteolytic subunit [Klebsiella pneumoniae]
MVTRMTHETPFFRREDVFTLTESPTALQLPLFAEAVPAGFPSPAGDYIEQELDLNTLCIRHPSATYFLRASGESMRDLGLYDGDILVVDRAETALDGDVVIAEVDGGFTVKRLRLHPRPALEPMNPAFPTRYPETLTLFGVVMHFIHNTRTRL